MKCLVSQTEKTLFFFVVVLEPYEMSGIPDQLNHRCGYARVLEPYEMSGIPDHEHTSFFLSYVLEPL